ncbi:MAG: fasciclin domain-containing protein [Phycisphaerae bacterium]|nr:fasciclin domain-containing protein [Phycisphaerae bacterium]
MLNLNSKIVGVVACGLGLALSSAPVVASDCGGKKDIVSTAVAAGDFDTLVAAVKAADLVETLQGSGPFTVFAPTDEAFAKLPKGALDELLANPDRLKAVLLQHVVPGRVLAADVVKLNSATTALGQSLAIDTSRGVRVGSANVVKTDIETSNGVIHVIDSVLLPQADIVEVARNAGSFKTLLTALEAAGLTGALRGDGPFTVFAPTDDAFSRLPAGTLDSLLADPSKLKAVLTYHVVPGRVLAADVATLKTAKTLQGKSLPIDTSSGVKVDNAQVIKTDIRATNGVIHVIDAVMVP